MNQKTAKLLRKFAYMINKGKRGYKEDKREYLSLSWKDKRKMKKKIKEMIG
jgi:hypothetical protein